MFGQRRCSVIISDRDWIKTASGGYHEILRAAQRDGVEGYIGLEVSMCETFLMHNF